MTKIDPAGSRALYVLARDAFLQFSGAEAARFAALLPADPGPARPGEASWSPGTSHLVEARPEPAFAPLFNMMTGMSRSLAWRSNYASSDLDRQFVESQAYTELMGPRGTFASDKVAFGIMVMGPECFYPDHRHQAEEVYALIAGQGEWRYDMGAWKTHRAGETVHSTPNTWHALRTRGSAMLILYAWTGGDLSQVSEIAPNARHR